MKASDPSLNLPFRAFAIAIVLWAGGTRGVSAQTFVVLPDTSLVTAAAAKVTESARVTVPAGVTFPVSNVRTSTVAPAATVTVSQIVLASTTAQLRISLKGGASTFTPPKVGATTWAAGDVSWNAASWTAAAGRSGILSQGAYNVVATCNANVATCSTSALVFTLAPNATVKRSGAHTLVVTWKFESF